MLGQDLYFSCGATRLDANASSLHILTYADLCLRRDCSVSHTMNQSFLLALESPFGSSLSAILPPVYGSL